MGGERKGVGYDYYVVPHGPIVSYLIVWTRIFVQKLLLVQNVLRIIVEEIEKARSEWTDFLAQLLANLCKITKFQLPKPKRNSVLLHQKIVWSETF